MDFLWAYTDANGFHSQPKGTEIKPNHPADNDKPNKQTFIIPPQCLDKDSGSSITVYFTIHDAGGKTITDSRTFNVELCGEAGDVLDIHLSLGQQSSTDQYLIEVVSATLTPWEEAKGSLNTGLED